MLYLNWSNEIKSSKKILFVNISNYYEYINMIKFDFFCCFWWLDYNYAWIYEQEKKSSFYLYFLLFFIIIKFGHLIKIYELLLFSLFFSFF